MKQWWRTMRWLANLMARLTIYPIKLFMRFFFTKPFPLSDAYVSNESYFKWHSPGILLAMFFALNLKSEGLPRILLSSWIYSNGNKFIPSAGNKFQFILSTSYKSLFLQVYRIVLSTIYKLSLKINHSSNNTAFVCRGKRK